MKECVAIDYSITYDSAAGPRLVIKQTENGIVNTIWLPVHILSKLKDRAAKLMSDNPSDYFDTEHIIKQLG